MSSFYFKVAIPKQPLEECQGFDDTEKDHHFEGFRKEEIGIAFSRCVLHPFNDVEKFEVPYRISLIHCYEDIYINLS